MEDILLGTTDRSIVVFISDPASTDGSGKTGLTHADLTVSYTRVETDNDVTVTDVTSSLSTLSALTDAHADWGVKEVSSTLAPGLYRLDIADAVFASGAWYAVVYVMITTSAAAATPKAFRLIDPAVALLGVNVVQLSGDSTAADNAELFFDGTGYAGGTAKLQVQLADGVAHGGTPGSSTATLALKVMNVTNPDGNAITASSDASGSGLYLENTGGGAALSISAYGGASNGDAIVIYADRYGFDVVSDCAMRLEGGGGAGTHTGAMDVVRILNQTTDGHGINITANGTSKHGILVTGGTAGVCDGIKAVAGTGGVDIRGNITGNITGTAQLDLTQAVPNTNGAETVGDALNAARAQGFGKWAIVGTALTLYAADGTTVVRTFTLDSATVPTSRT